MISTLTGTLASKGPEGAVIDVGGIGFSVSMSTRALASLGEVGREVRVHTVLQVKEDDLSLVAFATEEERELFGKLTSVSGIGAKIALAALSAYDPGELASVIAAGDVAAVSSIPGIGKKTAQRVVLELEGKLSVDSDGSGASQSANMSRAASDAATALVSMGFSHDEAESALRGCEADDAASAIRYALSNLGGAR